MRGEIAFSLEIEAGPGARERIAAALGAAELASLLVRLPTARARDVAATRALVREAQAKGVATLVIDDVESARELGADGVHLSARRDGLSAYRAARELLGRQAIVGAEAGALRHDAMELGEAGADYVAFAPSAADDTGASDYEQIERVAWWAEVFEVPCVALGVVTADAARRLAEAGADFLALRLSPAASPTEVRTRVAEIIAAVRGDVHAR